MRPMANEPEASAPKMLPLIEIEAPPRPTMGILPANKAPTSISRSVTEPLTVSGSPFRLLTLADRVIVKLAGSELKFGQLRAR